MQHADISDAATRLSHWVEVAANGEDVVITGGAEPLARITALSGRKRGVTFGLLKGQLVVPGDFDSPLPESVLADFEGR